MHRRIPILFAALLAVAEFAVAPAAGFEPIAADWRAIVLEAIERSEYNASSTSLGIQAPNRAQNLRAFFRDGAIEVVPLTGPVEAATWRFGWSTTAWGREGDMRAFRPGAPETDGRRVTYTGVDISEWYENREEGLEQGFTVHNRAPGDGLLRIEGHVDGGLRAELRPDGTVDFVDGNGVRVLNYGKLRVWDAAGTELVSWLEVEQDLIAIAVDDRAALYPLTVDPILTSPD
jgi:hypothetical protein